MSFIWLVGFTVLGTIVIIGVSNNVALCIASQFLGFLLCLCVGFIWEELLYCNALKTEGSEPNNCCSTINYDDIVKMKPIF